MLHTEIIFCATEETLVIIKLEDFLLQAHIGRAGQFHLAAFGKWQIGVSTSARHDIHEIIPFWLFVGVLLRQKLPCGPGSAFWL